ncbi:hypothetical protein F4801DRAFT_18979 [Xylaria longipes]|nr:hypothetical protein F4801DRAFT_18979 [Xylaria longipes]
MRIAKFITDVNLVRLSVSQSHFRSGFGHMSRVANPNSEQPPISVSRAHPVMPESEPITLVDFLSAIKIATISRQCWRRRLKTTREASHHTTRWNSARPSSGYYPWLSPRAIRLGNLKACVIKRLYKIVHCPLRCVSYVLMLSTMMYSICWVAYWPTMDNTWAVQYSIIK